MVSHYGIYLGLSAVLFALGAIGVGIRRNPLIMFMCIELMLNSANLAFATFAKFGVGAHPGGENDGPIFVFLVMTIAAAEAVVGLAIIIAIFRSRSDVDADELASMKG